LKQREQQNEVELRKIPENFKTLTKSKLYSDGNPNKAHATQTAMPSQSGNKRKARPKINQKSTPTLKNCQAFKTGISVLVNEGDVTSTEVQCLCIATNTDLYQGGTVADAVDRAAGENLHKEAVRTLTQRKGLKVGAVCETGAGQLTGKSCVLHTVVPEWDSYKPYSEVRYDLCVIFT